ncbi:MAG: tRNA (adenosine(37)-N6)-threonylcarbamoyltransferase complex transferase subunit TsaD [Parachlamydia sp.]|jgi:N6-L-threonylcarbamoyladenine synthase|nr:tRNA (adenosine(37)-N6)-threonylcarbamoyltransferase complex transferase subunit TsaD [Parachlamydia sp.]
MLVLGIESTCDETACAVVKDGKEILSNVVASQIDLHKEYGGVVPELACRRHIDLIIPVLDRSLKEANVTIKEIDVIAVAKGPGLIGALLIGLNTAKALSFAEKKPLIGINHIEAHLYAALMSHEKPVEFPCLGVVLSGGHTSLVLMEEIGSYQLIGQTVDDAIGEAFDKVAKMMNLPYPGGPQIEALARQGDPHKFLLKAGQVKGHPFDFSFSGLKTAVLYTIRGPKNTESLELTEENKCDLAASFQHAALNDIIKKTVLAAGHYQVKNVIFGGGVTNNQKLRELFAEEEKLNCIWPAPHLSLDNAAMIAGLGYHQYLRQGSSDPLTLDAMTRIPFNNSPYAKGADE